MKLFTLNTHSIQEENYPQKLEWFVDAILREQPDVLALQEVNQTMTAPPAESALLTGYVPAPGSSVPILGDNHAAQVAGRLRAAGVPCSWTWLPAKRGYEKYDEGLALLSLGRPIAQTDAFYVSGCTGYDNWRTRKALGVRLEGDSDWFYAVHMGWWEDGDESFVNQWAALERQLAPRKKEGAVWLMGDFNAPAEIRGESYDCVGDAGWLDTYCLAARKDGGLTVRGVIDGWRDRAPDLAGLRIDQIWCSRPQAIARSQVLFNGENYPVVSDHFGLLVETGPEVTGGEAL